MQALYFDRHQLHFRPDYPEPVVPAGEALVRIRLAGICATDLEIVKGYLGFQGVPGHEFVGEVCGSPDEAWLGKRVVGSINAGCLQCEVCRGQGVEHCPERTVLGISGRDGAFADYLTLPLINLLEVPVGLADEEAVFAEPVAAALRICEQVSVRPSARMAVVGPGRLGLLVAQLIGLTGAAVTVYGRSPSSLVLAAKLGLAHGLVAEAASDAFDLVVEATGNAEGLAHSLRMVKPRGTMVLKSTFAGRASIDLTKIVVGEVRVLGSRCGPMDSALKVLASGGIRVLPFIDGEYALAEGAKAFAHAARPGVKKVLLRPVPCPP